MPNSLRASAAALCCCCCCCRLFLLQPAVPFAGLFRLIDVPVSNCIHSGISNIYVLTQYNATSLNRHLSRAYQFLNGITFQGWCV
jgi:glucose-1-phosphate adenylyltransferase